MTPRPSDLYDVIVLGGGPAGGTAALFAGRIGRSTLLLSGPADGSLIGGTGRIDNFPGVDGISGQDFLHTLQQQCHQAGVTWVRETATHLDLDNRIKILTDEHGRRYQGKSLIIATGTRPIKPPLEHLDRFWGNGVSTCAWCDGPLYRNRTVAVYGGGNTAFTSAELLSRVAGEVILLLPKKEGTAFFSLRETLRRRPNVRMLPHISLEGLTGNATMTGVYGQVQGEAFSLPVDGLFIALGQVPQTAFARPVVELSASGFVKADASGQTSVPGIFAAGDVVEGLFRQLVTACGSGSIAALGAEQHLNAQW